MPVYKVTFVKNEIVSCREAEIPPRQQDKIQYEHQNGQMVHAFIPADSAKEANQKALDIVRNLSRGKPRD